MQTTITARHCDISDALRERALAVSDRLATFAPRGSSVVAKCSGLTKLPLAILAHGSSDQCWRGLRIEEQPFDRHRRADRGHPS